MKDARFNKYYKSTAHFEITNPNQRWKEQRGFVWHTGDCCIRALANSIGCEWIDAFDYLAVRARRDLAIMNDGLFFRQWLTEGGAVWTPETPRTGHKRMTVLQFAEKHPTGRYIVRVSHHEAAVVDGVIRDAWNCGDCCIFGYLDMSKFRLK